jgi:hypothetical protein
MRAVSQSGCSSGIMRPAFSAPIALPQECRDKRARHEIQRRTLAARIAQPESEDASIASEATRLSIERIAASRPSRAMRADRLQPPMNKAACRRAVSDSIAAIGGNHAANSGSRSSR